MRSIKIGIDQMTGGGGLRENGPQGPTEPLKQIFYKKAISEDKSC